jgi:hypothetical protein
MPSRKRTLFRLLALVIGTLVVLLSHAQYQRTAFEIQMEHLRAHLLPDYLREAFPSSLFGDRSGVEPDTLSIRRRIDDLNAHYKNSTAQSSSTLAIAITRVGSVESGTPAPEFRTVITVPLTFNNRVIPVELVASEPPPVTAFGIALALAFFAMGLLLIRLVPHPAPFNAFPLSRDMAIILDRKVSADTRWGAYRLTHLGGGGRLDGIQTNDHEACNDPGLRLACFRDVQDTYHRVRPRLLAALSQTDIKSAFTEAMDSGFCTAREMLKDHAPHILGEFSVSDSFRPYVRDQVLGFSLISFHDPSILSELTGIPQQQVTVDPPPAWLIGGYEIYYPRALFSLLTEEIRSGLRSAYGRGFDHVRVSADSRSEFISIDFVVKDIRIGPDAEKRLGQYLIRAFPGGLSRTEAYMRGFGRFLIFDAQFGFDITNRGRVKTRNDSGLVNRLEFRKIRPEELTAVRKLVNT